MEHGDLMSNRNDTRHILFIAAPEIEGGAIKRMCLVSFLLLIK